MFHVSCFMFHVQVDWKRLATAVNKAGGTPITTSWNGKVYDTSNNSNDSCSSIRHPWQRNTSSPAAVVVAPTSTRRAGSYGGGGGNRGGDRGNGMGVDDTVEREILKKALDAVRHRVKHYRMYLKPSFQVSVFTCCSWSYSYFCLFRWSSCYFILLL